MKKLDHDDQNHVRAYLKNLHNIYEVDIILTVCCVCGRQMGVKSGGGEYGISESYCGPCREEIRGSASPTA